MSDSLSTHLQIMWDPPLWKPKLTNIYSFETRLGPAGRPGTQLTRGWNRAGLKKKYEKSWPGVTRPTRRVNPAKPGQKPGCNQLIFFYWNDAVLNFFKNRNWPGRPGQNPEPGPWTEPGLKTMIYIYIASMAWIEAANQTVIN